MFFFVQILMSIYVPYIVYEEEPLIMLTLLSTSLQPPYLSNMTKRCYFK